jgi:hypothetical protein
VSAGEVAMMDQYAAVPSTIYGVKNAPDTQRAKAFEKFIQTFVP